MCTWRLFFGVTMLQLAAGIASPAPVEPASQPEHVVADDPVEVLVPRKGRTEFLQERVEASALVIHARLLVHARRYAEALQRYQRAYQYGAPVNGVLAEIVNLAAVLRRWDEAARYLQLAGQSQAVDEALVRQTAAQKTLQRDYAPAVALYEQLARRPLTPETRLEIEFEMGRLYLLLDDNPKAAEHFQVVLQSVEQLREQGLDPQLETPWQAHPDIAFALMGGSFLEANKYELAERAFRRSATGDEDLRLKLNLARLYAAQGNVDAARQQLQPLLIEPVDEFHQIPYRLLGQLIQHETPDLKAAQRLLIRQLDELYQKHPRHLPLVTFLADQLVQDQQWDRARQLYQQIPADERSLDAYQGLVQIAYQRRSAELLLDILGQFVQQVGSLDPLADTLAPLEKDPQFVQHLADEASQRRQSERLVHAEALAMAQWSMAAEQYDDADAFYALAVAAQGDQRAPWIIRWAVDMLRVGRPARAVSILRSALNDSSAAEAHGEFHFYLSGALLAQEDYLAALAAAHLAAQQLPESPVAAARPAWVAYVAGNHEEAQRAYRNLLARYENDYSSSDVRDTVREARLILANISVQQGSPEEAQQQLQRVLDEFPQDPGALNDLAYLWAENGQRLLRSLAMTRKAVQAEPDNPAYCDSLGWTLYQLRRYREAVEQLEKAAQIQPPDAIILDHWGDALWKSGQHQRARTAWQQAIDVLGDKQPERRQAIHNKLVSKPQE